MAECGTCWWPTSGLEYSGLSNTRPIDELSVVTPSLTLRMLLGLLRCSSSVTYTDEGVLDSELPKE